MCENHASESCVSESHTHQHSDEDHVSGFSQSTYKEEEEEDEETNKFRQKYIENKIKKIMSKNSCLDIFQNFENRDIKKLRYYKFNTCHLR